VDIIGHPQILPTSDSSSTTILNDEENNTPEWKERKLINNPVNIYDISSSLGKLQNRVTIIIEITITT
jgi:hypothetical protein